MITFLSQWQQTRLSSEYAWLWIGSCLTYFPVAVIRHQQPRQLTEEGIHFIYGSRRIWGHHSRVSRQQEQLRGYLSNLKQEAEWAETSKPAWVTFFSRKSSLRSPQAPLLPDLRKSQTGRLTWSTVKMAWLPASLYLDFCFFHHSPAPWQPPFISLSFLGNLWR